VKRIEELDMYDTLESLQLHPVEVVYEKVYNFLTKFRQSDFLSFTLTLRPKIK